jgi:hypothetical protein
LPQNENEHENRRRVEQALFYVRRKCLSLVTGTAAGIGEAFACFGSELPIVGVGLARELQDAEGCRVAQFAVGLWRAERAVILAAGASNEFANAARGSRASIMAKENGFFT